MGPDGYGISLSISGDHALIAAPYDDSDSGSAYVYERDDSGAWREVAKLVASDGAPEDYFGGSVSLEPDRALIGAYGDDDERGSAYVFERDSSGAWTEAAKLVASDGAPEDYFGRSVALSGDRAIAGAPGDGDLGMFAGSAYVFERDADGRWIEVAKLFASDGAAGDSFGSDVSLSGDFALVGVSRSAIDFGPGYVFRRGADGAWYEAVELQASDEEAFEGFGDKHALSGDLALISAPLDDEAEFFAGSVYFFDLEPLSGGGVTRLSVSEGGGQPLEVDAGHLHAGETYLVLGTMSGTAPGIPLPGGLTLPLHPDRYFRHTLHAFNRPPLANSFGVLDAMGHADASFTLAPTDLSLAGLTLHHAFVTFDDTRTPTFASNALLLLLVD